MKYKLNEQLNRIKRLMPKILVEDVTATAISNAPVEPIPSNFTNTIGPTTDMVEKLGKRIGMEEIDVYFEKALKKLNLISREGVETEAKILYDSVTKRITKINWDKLKPIDIENLMKLEPIRNAFEKEFIATNRLNIEMFMKDEVAKEMVKKTNLRFYNLIETFIKETPNVINSSNVKNFIVDAADLAKEIFTKEWFTGMSRWFSINIGTTRLFQIFRRNLSNPESLKMREYGRKLFQEYDAYLHNDGGMRPIDTAEYEQKIYEYLLKLNTFTKDTSKRIWNELRENMPVEVQKQFFGQSVSGAILPPVYSVERLKQMINHFEKLDPKFATEWTGYFQGLYRMMGDLKLWGPNMWKRKLDFGRRLLNLGLAAEPRLAREFLDNIEVQGGRFGKTLKKEMMYRAICMYFVYPAIMSAWEVYKVQFAQTVGRSPYFKLGLGQLYAFQLNFYPNDAKDSELWLEQGKEGMAPDIWLQLFNKNYVKFFKQQSFYNIFWHSPVYEHISKYANDPKTSEKNKNAAMSDADRVYNEALLKFQEDTRKMLYNDPKYKDLSLESKDSIYNNSIQLFQDSASRGKADTTKLLEARDIEATN